MSNHPNRDLGVGEFDYDLPADLIAQVPLQQRDASRLLVVDGQTSSIRHARIRDLPSLLRPGDLMVANNTKVLPARILGVKQPSGGRVELLLLHRDPDGCWTCLAKPAKSLRRGVRVAARRKDLVGTITTIEIVEKLDGGIVRVGFLDGDDLDLEQIGEAPLPPYIRTPIDRIDRYQTLYAKVPGSAAAPTAGLHLTDTLRSALNERGIGWAEVTLHIGLDTFRPVTVETVGQHTIHREWCSLSPEVARSIETARSSGGRIVAVGTTSARTLETWGGLAQEDRPGGYEGWSNLFITPGYCWNVVDALLTNFHLPRSTLLMMVSAFVGRALILEAYREAIADRYRFYSFGDATLLFRETEGETAVPNTG
jgi:S-adenosylmethionine:tRNA ribosyltransferase-isomerase